MQLGSVRTYTGHYVNCIDPDVETIDPRDIAHHLSLECRWAGATSRHYSVAEHSIYVAKFAQMMVRESLRDQAVAFGLLHDAHEAYLKDIPTPIKKMLGSGYVQLCDGLDVAIFNRFKLPEMHEEVAAAVHNADHYTAWCEATALLAKIPGMVSGTKPPDWLLQKVPMLTDVRRLVEPRNVEQQWLGLLRFEIEQIGGRL